MGLNEAEELRQEVKELKLRLNNQKTRFGILLATWSNVLRAYNVNQGRAPDAPVAVDSLWLF